MLPVVAIVGRPNVGKSTLFNCLTKSREALVADQPGLTRDRKYGQGKLGEKPYIVIDTAGIGEEADELNNLMTQQAQLAMQEADVILFLVDARAGVTSADQEIASMLRELNKKIYLIVNKTDGLDPHVATADFFSMGLGQAMPIAANVGRGVTQLIQHVLEPFPEITEQQPAKNSGIRVAIIGKPNVGKSTLVNRMLGEERVIVCDKAGTTRDSLEIPIERFGKQYTIIDTAGIRRRGKVNETVEKFSVVKSLQAIDYANVVIFMIDAKEGITDQDLSLLGFILDAGRSLVVAVNKWDGLEPSYKDELKQEIERRLIFVKFAKLRFTSALYGTGVGDLFSDVDKAYASAMCPLATKILTRLLERALREFQPPLVSGRRIKLRYANPGGHNPPIIVIHGNQTESVPQTYQRYLANFFREALKLTGTPLRLQFKSSDNPFKDRRKNLTPLQEYKKSRARRMPKKT